MSISDASCALWAQSATPSRDDDRETVLEPVDTAARTQPEVDAPATTSVARRYPAMDMVRETTLHDRALWPASSRDSWEDCPSQS